MSTTTYLQVCNSILAEMNEVLLTSSSFSNATNVQLVVKNAVNQALFDIYNKYHKWPFLSASASTDPYLGNTYVETVAGTRWYLLKPTSGGVDEDYGFVDWDSFTRTTEGVAGESAPYDIQTTKPITIIDWRKKYSDYENEDEANDQNRGEPFRVIRSVDGRRFGLSPIPKKVYRIYFWAWDQGSEVTAHGDTFPFQNKFVQAVLLQRVRYYGWLFKENEAKWRTAETEYKAAIDWMRTQLIEDGAPKHFTDSRTRNSV